MRQLLVGSLKMNTALEYSTRVVQEGERRCKKSTLKDLAYLTPLRIPLMNPVFVSITLHSLTLPGPGGESREVGCVPSPWVKVVRASVLCCWCRATQFGNRRRPVPPRACAAIQLTPRRYNHAISCKLKHTWYTRKTLAVLRDALRLFKLDLEESQFSSKSNFSPICFLSNRTENGDDTKAHHWVIFRFLSKSLNSTSQRESVPVSLPKIYRFMSICSGSGQILFSVLKPDGIPLILIYWEFRFVLRELRVHRMPENEDHRP